MCGNCMRWNSQYGCYTASAPRLGRRNSIRRTDSLIANRRAKYLDMRNWNQPEPIDYEEGVIYNDREKEQLADQFLREDARAIDPATGKAKGISGPNPILFEEHLAKRRSREIMGKSLTSTGIIDPAFTVNSNGQRGMYNRQAPDGRKVNSEEQRQTHGASYFRN